MLDLLNEVDDYPLEIKQRLLSQTQIKCMILALEMKRSDFEKFSLLDDYKKSASPLVTKGKFKSYLLTIESSQIKLFTVKHKDELDIDKVQIEEDPKKGLKLENKFMFILNYEGRSRLGLTKQL